MAAAPIMVDRYEVMCKVGKGSFGSVYLVKAPSGNHYAMKRVRWETLTAAAQDKALQEMQLLRELHHPFIVRYHDGFCCSGRLHLVMEWACGGDLRSRIQKQTTSFPEADILFWLAQLTQALVPFGQKDAKGLLSHKR